MDLLSVIWLALVIIFLLIAMGTLTYANLFLAGGAASALICALVGGSISVQVLVFAVVSCTLFVVLHPLMAGHGGLRRNESTVSRLNGATATVVETIDDQKQTGKVKVRGQIWHAGTVTGEGCIPEGSQVEIRKVRGGKLIVEEKNDRADAGERKRHKLCARR